MAITICGAGAIGGTIAAYLARSGEAVRCVDRVADIASPDPAAARASLDGMAARARAHQGPLRPLA